MVGVSGSEAENRVLTRPHQQVTIPVSVFFDRNISVLEALVEYLKERYKLNFATIGRLTNRDERNIGTAYRRAKEKRRIRTPPPQTDIYFPLEAVADRSLSIFESIVVYLREGGISNVELAQATNRSTRTISTVYVRAKRKKNG